MTKSEERKTHEDREIQSSSTTTESTQGNNKVLMELFLGKEGKEEKTEQKKWLNYVAPTVRNGEKIMELFKEEVELETMRCKHALILYVVGIDPMIATIERYNAAQWNYIAKPKTKWQQKRGEQQGEPSKTSENSGLVEIEEEVVSPRQERVNQHEGQGIRNVQEGRQQEGKQLQA
ncbi:hypothetical protein R3W88_016087 [Solanum pinnatisectum]|uniref:Uncharacterized protein n=1 Tax=Solanum pinnatisectum TaxID=50273 RepID=A0AAV9KWV9_9SOLN|nr:hypothetical protein R3W88_016087 [Solanum pinnatisectum]